MDVSNTLTLVLSLSALILSIISFWKSNAVSNANLEINIYNMIRSSRSNLHNLSQRLIDLEEDGVSKSQGLMNLYESLIEEYVTSYEVACSKYLDNKVDKKRFEKSFRNDIRRLVENDKIVEIAGFSKPSAYSNYGAILRVYELWFNKEK